MVHDLSTLRRTSIRIIISLAVTKGFKIFSHDVSRAYLQSDEQPTRDMYLQPKKKDFELFNINKSKVLKLLKLLYVTCNAGDYWNKTISSHIQLNLHMVPSRSDHSLFYKMGNDKNLEGLIGVYVDDELLAGNDNFERKSKIALLKFD